MHARVHTHMHIQRVHTLTLQADDDSEADESSGQACELCGRTFPHEHIRAVYRGGVEGEDDEDSEFGDGDGV